MAEEAGYTSKITTDHEEIQKWAEGRQGKPAVVKDTAGADGILRVNFPGFSEKSLDEISWEKFFKIFDDKKLAFLCQEKTKEGELSRFFKFVKR